MKRLFKSAASRNGSYSVGMTALVIAIVVVVNLIAGQLPEKVKHIDISDNKIYDISKKSKNILKDLDQQVIFEVYAEKKDTDERIRTFIEKYTALSGKIKVEWIDPVLHPAELTENNVEADTILISCKDTGKSTTVTFDQIIVMDASSYYTTGSASESEFDGEGQFTGAVSYVTSGAAKKIYYTTGHGESTFSTSVSDQFEKNNMDEEELNLMMTNEIPDDCDLLFLYGPVSDLAKDEKNTISAYLSEGGKVFLMLGDTQEDTPNLNALMTEYGMKPQSGYIADMERCYQGNYYDIFPEISASGDLADGLTSDMVMLYNSRGMNNIDPERDTVTVTPFMTTSENSYAVTEDAQEKGTYTLGAVATEPIATESVSSDQSDGSSQEEENTDKTDNSKKEASSDQAASDERTEKEARFTVVTSASLIDPQITEAFATLENTTLFTNAVTANFDDVQNTAIEPKSLAVTYNTMQHAGLISILIIFIIPAAILIYGFVTWLKRRKA